MGGERSEPLPRRTTDRIHGASVVFLSVIGLLGALVIGVFALAGYASGAERAQREPSERTQVTASVLADAPVPSGSVARGAAVPVRVPFIWAMPTAPRTTGRCRCRGALQPAIRH